MSLPLTVAITSGEGACLHEANATSKSVLERATTIGLRRLKAKTLTCNLYLLGSPPRPRYYRINPNIVAPERKTNIRCYRSRRSSIRRNPALTTVLDITYSWRRAAQSVRQAEVRCRLHAGLDQSRSTPAPQEERH